MFLCSFVKFCFNKNVCYYYLNCFICFGALFMAHLVYICLHTPARADETLLYRVDEKIKPLDLTVDIELTTSLLLSCATLNAVKIGTSCLFCVVILQKNVSKSMYRKSD